MRPCVPHSLHRLWRADGVLQVGTEPGRSACVEGLDEASARWVGGLDGGRDTGAVLRGAVAEGLPSAVVSRALDGLVAAGVVDDAGLPARLGRARVEVEGEGALVRAVTEALEAAGVGTLAGAAARGGVDLVVRCEPSQGRSDGTPHLLVRCRDRTAAVGPLVVPGVTACGRCVDAHRTDRDPGWPLVAAQLAWPADDGGDPLLVLWAAALAAAEVRTFLLGTAPASVEGTLELGSGGWRVRRRSWPAHPGCGCGAAAAAAG